MKSIITDKWILCPECKAKTRTQVLENTELKNFPLFCPKCKKNFIKYKIYFNLIKRLIIYEI